jgi:hypothetical protein
VRFGRFGRFIQVFFEELSAVSCQLSAGGRGMRQELSAVSYQLSAFGRRKTGGAVSGQRSAFSKLRAGEVSA